MAGETLYHASKKEIIRFQQKVPKAKMKQLEALKGILGEFPAFPGYRRIIASVSPPCVPFPGKKRQDTFTTSYLF